MRIKTMKFYINLKVMIFYYEDFQKKIKTLKNKDFCSRFALKIMKKSLANIEEQKNDLQKKDFILKLIGMKKPKIFRKLLKI